MVAPVGKSGNKFIVIFLFHNNLISSLFNSLKLKGGILQLIPEPIDIHPLTKFQKPFEGKTLGNFPSRS